MAKEQWIEDAEECVLLCAESSLEDIEYCASKNDLEFDWVFEQFVNKLRKIKEDKYRG